MFRSVLLTTSTSGIRVVREELLDNSTLRPRVAERVPCRNELGPSLRLVPNSRQDVNVKILRTGRYLWRDSDGRNNNGPVRDADTAFTTW